MVPALAGRVEPDLVHESFEFFQIRLCRGLRRVEVDMVLCPEMILEGLTILRDPVKAEERFAAGDAGSERAHALCDENRLLRALDPVLVCEDHVLSLALFRERAVPAGTPAASRNKEHHLCALVTEDTAFCEGCGKSFLGFGTWGGHQKFAVPLRLHPRAGRTSRHAGSVP